MLPFLFLIGPASPQRSEVAAAAARADWRVDAAPAGEAALATVRAGDHDLVGLDLALGHPTLREIVAGVRRDGGRQAAVPMIGLGAPPPSPVNQAGLDGIIDPGAGGEALAAALAGWMPGEANARPRLEAAFGAAAVAGLFEGLAAQLEEVLAFRSVDSSCRDAAHRLAGLAGTLGHRDVFQAWLPVADGDAEALGGARRRARVALHRLHRERTPHRATG